MDKVWSLVIDVFIGILIIFLTAAIYFGIRTETVKKTAVREMIRDFMTKAKREGCITTESYESLLDKLSATHEIYHLELEHIHEVFEPEYRFKTIQEILDEQNASYKGKNEYHYREVKTSAPEVHDPVYDGQLNTETNESVLKNAVNTPADPNHVHSDECYHGTKHIHTGSATSGGGCYGEKTSSSPVRCGASFSTGGNRSTPIGFSCTMPGCSGWCSGMEYYVYLICNNGHYTSFTFNFSWSCNSCGNSYSYSPGSPPTVCESMYAPVGYKINCGKTEGHYYNGDTEVFPICNSKLVNIAATHPAQTVATKDPLITTIRARYLDGSTKVVLGASDFSTVNPCQNQTATITYKYTLDGQSYTLTCTILVTVVPRTKTCNRGHIYNLKGDGSDPGCPYCKAWVDNIRVVYPTTSAITITIGTTLQQNGLKILVTYMDGHTETITNGYDDNLDTSYLGTKPVTIGYKGAVTYLTVTTVCAKTMCDICGREYDLYPDGSDPGCPYCIQKIPVFTGNVLIYEETEYTDAILNKLYSKGRYDMQLDDTFSIIIKNKTSPGSSKLLMRIFPSLSDNWIMYKQTEKIGAK